ncbi:MAG: epoxide hydrolase [Candidatus Angelobacter sp. Gp1-AA117]|nr:MAG: epoxide hydrolase [Candidatus Angelobacter sp. Gp1-AA117]
MSAQAIPEPPIESESIQANGQTFEVFTCGSGDKLALCLHGFPEHALSWRRQLPMLARLGYRAWAPNQRGYGKSSRPQGIQEYALEKLRDDVAGLIDASGAKETVLIAHDWGAVVAWNFAIRQVRPLSALIILNVPHPKCYLDRLYRSKQFLKSWYIFFFQLPWLPERMLTRHNAKAISNMILRSSTHPEQFPRDLLDIFRENVLSPGAATAMVNWYRALFRGGGARRGMRDGFPVIETRTLMLWGEEDVALDKSTTYGTDRYVKDLTLRYLPGISHWVQQDAPEAVNEMIACFLSGKPVPQFPQK